MIYREYLSILDFLFDYVVAFSSIHFYFND